MHKLIVVSTLLFATACGHKQAPPAHTASQSSTVAPKTETKDKDSKVDEGAKDKDGDHDKDDDEGPAKAKK
jgi:hypothetical protein